MIKNFATMLIRLGAIDPNPYQVRQAEDPVAVAELAVNIEKNSLLQSPTVRQIPLSPHNQALRYQLAFGHSRLAAYKLLTGQEKAGYDHLPCYVRDLDDLQMFELAVAENIKRRDLNPIERARAMQTYMDKFNKTSAETGKFFACDEATVRGSVRLLGLPEAARAKLSSGEITVGAARALLTLQRIAPEDEIGRAAGRGRVVWAV
jgi:ParB family chromosome partitioning protein